MKAQDTTHINMRAAGITMALAALVIAVLAVTLAAGPAQATTTTTDFANSGDDNSIPQGQAATATPTSTPIPPRHATPEPCPGETGNPNETAARVIDSGHYALFDVYWNPVERELTNNICPPSTQYVRTGRVRSRIDRSPSSIDITAEPPTIIHIPSSRMVDLSTTTEYTEARYPAVWDADDAENRDTDGDGTPDGVGDRKVWVLPPCPTFANSSAAGDLCLRFSTVLLKSADWDGNIKFHLDHVHQVDIDRQEPRYTLAYDIRPGAIPAPSGFQPVWNSENVNEPQMEVAPGRYKNPTWILTSRGTYDLQVHITGDPSSALTTETSVSSDQRKYILHVGAEADLGVAMTVTPETPSPGNNVTVAITAGNAGPDAVPNAKVDVTLPEGLTYLSHNTAAGTYADGVWTIGELANDASKTLTITATVDAGTHGQDLTVKAMTSATEPVKVTETVVDENGYPVLVEGTDEPKKKVVTHHVPVPDPTPGNEMAKGTITVASLANVDPKFMVERSVLENSSMGTNVGTPVLVKNPESGDTLTFTLSGDGKRNFTVEAVDGGAQIKVAEGSYLNHEDTTSTFDLTLQVSDGKDRNGNVDNSVDDTVPVLVAVGDVSESAGITLTAPSTATAGQYITLQASLGDNPPVPRGEMDFVWVRRSPSGEIDWRDDEHASDEDFNITYGSAGVKQYAVFGVYFDRSGLVRKTVESAWVEVTWSNPE